MNLCIRLDVSMTAEPPFIVRQGLATIVRFRLSQKFARSLSYALRVPGSS